jgi:hypothetical protein
MQSLNVIIDPRIWETEHIDFVKMNAKLIQRAEIAYDELANMAIDESKRVVVNTTWYGWKSASKGRL